MNAAETYVSTNIEQEAFFCNIGTGETASLGECVDSKIRGVFLQVASFPQHRL